MIRRLTSADVLCTVMLAILGFVFMWMFSETYAGIFAVGAMISFVAAFAAAIASILNIVAPIIREYADQADRIEPLNQHKG